MVRYKRKRHARRVQNRQEQRTQATPLMPEHMRRAYAIRAARQRPLPTFDVELQRAFRRPHTITFTPRAFTDQMDPFRDIARVIRREVTRQLSAFNHGAVNGVLFATNLANPASNRYRAFTRLTDINIELIGDLIEEFGNSETTVDIDDVEWQVLIDPGTYTHGAGISVPHYLAKKTRAKHLGWMNHSDGLGPINCAAIAITLCIARIEYSKNEGSQRQLLVDARRLQTELGWGENVTLPQISNFVQVYKKYRITVLNSVATSFSHHTYTGTEFDNEIDRDTSKNTNPFIIYIQYDPMQRHYADCKSPAAFFQRVHNNNHQRFCHKCIKVYRDNHTCDDGQVIRKTVPLTVWCEHCDSHVPPQHKHGMKQCRTCDGLYDISTGYNNHRCILIEDEKEDLGIFLLTKVTISAGRQRKIFQQNGTMISKLFLIQFLHPTSRSNGSNSMMMATTLKNTIRAITLSTVTYLGFYAATIHIQTRNTRTLVKTVLKSFCTWSAVIITATTFAWQRTVLATIHGSYSTVLYVNSNSKLKLSQTVHVSWSFKSHQANQMATRFYSETHLLTLGKSRLKIWSRHTTMVRSNSPKASFHTMRLQEPILLVHFLHWTNLIYLQPGLTRNAKRS